MSTGRIALVSRLLCFLSLTLAFTGAPRAGISRFGGHGFVNYGTE